MIHVSRESDEWVVDGLFVLFVCNKATIIVLKCVLGSCFLVEVSFSH